MERGQHILRYLLLWYTFVWRAASDCPDLNAPVNGNVHYSAKTELSEAAYTCNAGYILTGTTNFQVCQADDTWSDIPPTCEPKNCGALSLTDGSVSYSPAIGPVFDVTATFTCNTGFSLTGSSTQYCDTDGAWTDAMPTCDVVDCGALVTPSDGQISVGLTTYDSERTFTCSTGYNLNGASSIRCTETGAWSDTVPTCVIVDCGALPTPSNGELPSGATTYDTTRTFTCDTGYAMTGSATTTCTVAGTWSTQAPTCDTIDCGAPAAVTDGSFTLVDTTTTYLSRVQYTCTTGYNMNGASEITCSDSGAYSPVAPTCDIHDCGPVPTIANGNAVAAVTTYGSTIDYSCDVGYDLYSGGTIMNQALTTGTCTVTGWDMPIPTCVQNTAFCPEITITDGTYTGSRVYDAVATFTCDTGYSIVGTNPVTCQSPGTWSDTLPTCSIVDCGTPAAVTDGSSTLVDTTTTYLSRVQYTCTTGYNMNGASEITCSDTGTYSPAAPTCDIHDCGGRTNPTNGLVSLLNGIQTFGAVASYTCNTGYELLGENTLDCTITGWDPAAPTCRIYDCGNLGAPANGAVDISGGTVYDDVATYWCDTGYDLTGVMQRTCQHLGVWDGAEPTCVPVDCGPLTAPTNGALDTSLGTTFSQTATYTCDTGHDMTGDPTPTCQADTQWSSAAPTCAIHDCGGLPNPSDGAVSLQNGASTYDSTATYTCTMGYQMMGASTLTCTMAGWDPAATTSCQIYDCGILINPTNGQVDITGGTLYQNVATYSCDTGYTLSGVSQRTCQNLGAWSDTEPTCDIVDCGAPASPTDGSVVLTLGSTYTETATFSCDTGYDMTGSVTATCQASGLWTASPTCNIHDCGGPSIPNDGAVSLQNGMSTYQSIATYTCNTGYQLMGSSTQTCTETTWDPAIPPTCQIYDCGDPGNPTSGQVDITGGTLYQNVATYSCDTGYTLSGVSQRTCEDLGAWSDTEPTCDIVDCGAPASPTDGSVVLTLGSTYTETATFSCDTGYDMTGSATATCQASGLWTASPTCNIHDCGGPSNPNDGAVSLQNGVSTYQSIATYTCDTGYQLMGSSTQTCTETTWNPAIPPTCQIYDCGDPGNPTSGQVDITGGTLYQNVATYSCDTGYTLSGVSQRTCEDLGAWSDTEPTCDIVDCGAPTAPTDGTVVTAQGTTYDETATFSCDTGYDMVGSDTALCQADGQWSNTAPTCTIHDCGGRTNPTNGLVSLLNNLQTFGAVASYTCNTGYQLLGDFTLECTMTGWDPAAPTCQIYDCGDPGNPTNGQVDITGGTLYQNVATYSCDTGYTLTGVSQRTCEDLGAWSDTEPTCDIVDCGAPTAPTDGTVVTAQGTTYDETATFSCDTGYDMVGSDTALCQADVQWSNTAPTCTIHDCGGPSNPTDGAVSLQNGVSTYQSIATYTCDTGYQLMGSSTQTCTETTWNPAIPPTCQIYDCGDPGNPTNGQVDITGGTLYQNVATYSCDTGYTLSGVAQRTCEDLGAWSDTEPTCDIVDCGAPTAPTDGTVVTAQGTTYDETVTFSCDTGYDMVGSDTALCQADGQWSNTAPTCTIHDCGGRTNPTNGLVSLLNNLQTFGAVASYTCNTGYQLLGDFTLECTMTGWDPADPTCRIYDCGDPGNPTNGQVDITGGTQYQNVATYSCDTGYTLSGVSQRTCEDLGAWSDTEPTCDIVDCGAPTAPTDGTVATALGTTYDETATFLCDMGYDMVGLDTALCQADGQWSNIAPTCTIHDCGGPSNPTDGAVSLQNGVSTYQSIATYTCDTGYQLMGSTTQTCTETTWNPAIPPTCQIYDCGDPGNPTNGQVDITGGTLYQNVATYSCDTGYTLTGVSQRTCEDLGAWSDTEPTCDIVDCGAPTAPTDGTVATAQGTTYDETATFSCDTGYDMVGSDTALCQADGQWSNTAPTCTIHDCGGRTNPTNGLVSLLNNLQTFGAVASYTCNTGYQLLGDFTLECTMTGWDPADPTCQIYDCGDPGNPTNGQVDITGGTLYQNVATYSCDTGYTLTGVSQRTCEDLGAWSDTEPTCDIVDCGVLASLVDGSVVIPQVTTYTETATFSCDTGYDMTGSATATCQASGLWTASPTCTIHDCGGPSNPTDGLVSLQNGVSTYQSIATYTCDTGYQLMGSSTQTCTATTWNPAIPPTCQIYDCGNLDNPNNGQVDITGGTLYAAVAIYSCDTGYNLNGVTQRDCQDLGAWSDTEPTCDIVDCGVPIGPTNGAVATLQGTTYDQTAVFSCDQGYDMTAGLATALCLATEQWSSDRPTCTLHDCGGLSNPTDGAVSLQNGVSTYGSVATFTCSTGHQLMGVITLSCTMTGWDPANPPMRQIYDCGNLAAPDNGQVDLSGGTQFGAAASFSCNTGYTLSTTQQWLCSNIGSWSNPPPTCNIVDCGAPNAPADGSVVAPQGTTYGETATFSCDMGYDMSGSATAMCQAGGQWGPAPTCTLHDCGSPQPNINNGQLDVTSLVTTYDGEATYSCNTGYQLIGDSTLECTMAGWDPASTPICQIWDCGDQLQHPDNGRVVFTAVTSFQSLVTYTCVTGYELVGDSTRTCEDGGIWSGTAPTCQIVSCGALTYPNGRANLNVVSTGTTYDSTATFTCDTGFNVLGAATVSCLASGQWSAATPFCTPVDCGALMTTLDNGAASQQGTLYSQTTTYTCDPGYQMSPAGETTRTVTCQDIGLWDNTVPTCSRVDCGGLVQPANGQVNVPSSLYQEIAAYTCNVGYTLVGTNHRRCLADATWNRVAPQCRVVENGQVNVPSSLYQEIAAYTGNVGYTLVGTNHRRCLADATWNRVAPQCRVVDCGDLLPPANGIVHTAGGLTYGQLATYTCHEGYHVTSGDDFRTCQADGNWGGTQPTCSLHDCGSLPTNLANGQVQQTGTTYGQTTTFTCDAGYYISGQQTELLVTCGSDGNWDNAAPRCIATDCPALTSPTNGAVSYTSTRLDSEATYTCQTGYRLDGVATRTCQQDSQWSASAPACIQIDCGILTDPQFGTVVTPDGTVYGSVATYSCRTGYYIQSGTATRRCLLTGQWEDSIPSCTIRDCGPLSESLNDGRVVTTGTLYRDTYIYTCDRGFFIASTAITSRTVTCTETGAWSDAVPTACVIVDCGPLVAPADGALSLSSGSLYQSLATYTCDTGYLLRGDGSRTCREDGAWDGTQPHCEIYDCGALLNPTSGNVVTAGGTTYGQSAVYSCDEGYLVTGATSERTCGVGGVWSGEMPSCVLYDCGDLVLPDNGAVSLSAHTLYGSRATYTCDVGYFRSEGSETRDCQFQTGWSGSPSVCTIYDCQSLQSPANGLLTTAGGTTYNQVAVYTCDSGYFISEGSEQRRCQANGLWDGTVPTCTLYECSSLTNPTNGIVTVSQTGNGEQADYTCDTGYYLSTGDATRTCLTGSRTWSGTEPTCTIHNCGQIITSLENGRAEGIGVEYGDTVTFTCNTGYMIAGDNTARARTVTITCTETGVWSAAQPTCAIVDCGLPDVPENGFLTSMGTSYGSIVGYHCREGYQLTGPASRTCQDDGEWSEATPTCTVYDCGSLLSPVNGLVTVTKETFGGMATYLCDTGYKLSDPSLETRVCLDGGVWSEMAPTCIIQDCGPLDTSLANGVSIQTGTQYLDTSTYRCDNGYLIANSTAASTTILCTATGDWSGEKPECVLIDCGALQPPDDGTVMMTDGARYLSVAIYRCSPGYRLAGTSSIICQDNGQWSDTPPTCDIHDCGDLVNPDNGVVDTSAGTTYGRVATYTCSNGYYISFGSQTRTCTDDGTWNGLAPTCADISTMACGFRNADVQILLSLSRGTTADMFNTAITAVQGLVDKSDVDAGSTRFSVLTYNTEIISSLSFLMNNFTTRAALRQALDSAAFIPVNTVSNTSKALESLWAISDKAEYGNRPDVQDYAVLITDVVTDVVTEINVATWMAGEIRKKGVILNVVTVGISDGVGLEGLQGLAFSGAHVYKMATYTDLLQLPASMFEHPHCDCGALPTPNNGLVDVSGGRYFLDEATYSCFGGYLMEGGDTTMVCQFDGSWAGTAPVCTEIDCGPLQNPEHGLVQTGGTRLSSMASYTCNMGYRMLGPSQRRCEATGAWSPSPDGNATTCQLIDCGPLSIPSNGNMAFTGTTFGNRARFVCMTGYTLVGQEELECRGDGRWSSPEPICVEQICGFRDADVLFMIGISPQMTAEDFNTHIKFAMKYVVGKSDMDSNMVRIAYFFFDDTIRSDVGTTFEATPRDVLSDQIDSLPFVPTSNSANVTLALETMLERFQNPFFGSEANSPNYAIMVTDGLPLTETELGLVLQANNMDINLAFIGIQTPQTANLQTIPGALQGVDVFLTYEQGQQYIRQMFEHSFCNCGQLPAPSNGAVQVLGSYYLDEAQYTCNRGYRLAGSSDTRVCRYRGSWVGIAPECVQIDCGQVQAPANGNLVLQGTSLGSTARFTCDTGYQLVGASTITCEESGQWSQSEPICEMESIDCPSLPDLVSGSVTLTAGQSSGSVATYTCDTGHFLVGVATRTCLTSGQWDGEQPRCQIHDCGTLQNPANGNMIQPGTTLYGAVVNFTCSVGYRLFGASSVTCNKDGAWSAAIPMCRMTDCGPLSNIADGSVTFSESTFGQMATYACDLGYVLSGMATRVCQADGQWSGTLPQCDPRECGTLLNPVNGAVDLSEGTTYESIARYSCNAGYRLEGPTSTTCLATGVWKPFSGPSCVLIDCGQLPIPANVQTSLSSGTGLGSVATLSCETGYRLTGSSSATCTEEGKWSMGEIPACNAIDCGTIPAFPDGSVTFTEGTLFGSVAQFSCNRGYILEGGVARHTCLATGEWSPGLTQRPTCTIQDCGALTPPTNGMVTTTTGTTYGSTASYTCNTGHMLVGSSTRTCNEQGSWSPPSDPVCSLVDCGQITGFANGRVTYTTGTVLGTTATFACDAGHLLVGSERLTCQATGSWSGDIPECRPNDCGPLSVPDGLVLFTDGSRLGSRASYTCNQGHMLTGPTEKLCTDQGWSPDTQTICTLQDCGTPSLPANGVVLLLGGTSVGEVAEYSCIMGLTLLGSQSITCLPSGNWSSPTPDCVVTDCMNLPNPEHGTVTASQTTFGQVAVYMCDLGYTLIGSVSRICTQDGSWSGQAPNCTIKDCGIHQSPVSGSVTYPRGTTFEQTAVYSCDEGFTLTGLSTRVCGPLGLWVGSLPNCIPIDCGGVPDIENGGVVGFPSSMFGSVATYICDEGYRLFGNAQITCLGSGWNTPPHCTIIQCGPLADIAQGSVETTGGDTFGQVAIYSCEAGYALLGDKMRTCTLQGDWDGSEPRCELVDCGDLSHPVNGVVIFDGTLSGSTATYTCDVGHALEGTPNRVCQNNGAWSDSRPTCVIRDCGDLAVPSNGQRTLSSGTTYGSVAEFSCNLMYNLAGERSLVCRADGTWSGSQPTCVLGDQLMALAMALKLNMTLGDNVDLMDNATRELYMAEVRDALLAYYRAILGSDVQDIILISVAKGSLDVTFTIVLRNREEAFQEFTAATGNLANYDTNLELFDTIVVPMSMEVDGTNVDVGANIVLDTLLCTLYLAAHGPCDSGYLCAVTSNTPTCQPDPNTDCGRPAAPANGQVEFPQGSLYGATMIYTCTTGYTLAGDNTRTCQASGSWQPAEPSCSLTDCGTLTAPLNGRVLTISGTRYEATGVYTCLSGYTLIGTAVVTCQASGLWSHPPPVCVITSCGTLEHPSNGNVSLTSDGQTALYACNRGYRLVGNSVRMCQTFGQWAGTIPTCEIISCPSLTNPPNGLVDVSSGTQYGQMATYSCVGPEYELIGGSTVRTCTEDGSWSGDAPSCSFRDCGMLTVISNGVMNLTGTKFGDIATFNCDSAYRLQGAAILTCKETGWDNPQPMCIHIGDCGPLSHPDNGAVYLGEGTNIGAQARYRCNTGYQLVGEPARECLASSQWAGTQPECRVQTCPSLSDPTGGKVQLSGDLTYGQMATYMCDTGHDLIGSPTVTCRADGTWSAATICKIKDCGTLPAPGNGSVDLVAGTEYGNQAQYSCNTGYSLVGPSTRQCGAAGMWSLTEPSCVLVDCQGLSAPTNGAVALPGGTTYGKTAIYTCDTGHNMTRGSAQRQCGADGQWSGSPLECELVQCASITKHTNGQITLTQGRIYGSTAIYSCNLGYVITGAHHNRTCGADRLWSGTPPNCVQVDCGSLSAPVFGSMVYSAGTGYGSTVTYSCSTGYVVDGVTGRTCGEDGSWSGSVPSCIVVDCGMLSDPRNGKVSMPQGTQHGRTASYTCDSDYELDGAKTRTCQADGAWSLEAPTCDSGTNFKLALGLGVGLSGFFIIVLVVILVAVIMYRRNLDRHELRMSKYGARSKIVEVPAPMPYTMPVKTKPRPFYLPYFRSVDDDYSEDRDSDYRKPRTETSGSRAYFTADNLPREEYYTMRYRP